jgi:hypothetical protein
MSLGFNSRGNNSTYGRTSVPVYLGSMRGAGSIIRKYNFCSKGPDPYFCLFDLSRPAPPPPPPPPPTYTFYYNKSDINNLLSPFYDTELINSLNYNKYQQSNLYNKNHDTTLGSIFYDISISNSTENGVYDVENAFLTINGTDGSVLNFIISLFNKSEAGYLNSGTYNFQITGGTGLFLNAKGYVNFTVINYERKLDIYLE